MSHVQKDRGTGRSRCLMCQKIGSPIGRGVSVRKFRSTSVDVCATEESEKVVPEIIHKKDGLSTDSEQTAV
jgi:hypothetical protein